MSTFRGKVIRVQRWIKRHIITTAKARQQLLLLFWSRREQYWLDKSAAYQAAIAHNQNAAHAQYQSRSTAAAAGGSPKFGAASPAPGNTSGMQTLGLTGGTGGTGGTGSGNNSRLPSPGHSRMNSFRDQAGTTTSSLSSTAGSGSIVIGAPPKSPALRPGGVRRQPSTSNLPNIRFVELPEPSILSKPIPLHLKVAAVDVIVRVSSPLVRAGCSTAITKLIVFYCFAVLLLFCGVLFVSYEIGAAIFASCYVRGRMSVGGWRLIRDADCKQLSANRSVIRPI